MNREIYFKYNLAPSTVNIGKSFVNNIPVYMDADCNYFSECNTLGDPIEKGKTMIVIRDIDKIKMAKFPDEFLLSEHIDIDMIKTILC